MKADDMRFIHPAPNIVGFYDGRVEGKRLFGEGPNWVDDGAHSLGVCSYALIDGTKALLFDTHVTLDHAKAIRSYLRDQGVHTIRVVLSHHHFDHIAGNAVFADCEILANRATAHAMVSKRSEAKSATPPIRPMIMPTRVFDSKMSLRVGDTMVELLSFDIHSHDGLVMWLPEAGILLAGDTLEDPITYVAEPSRLPVHLDELARLSELPIKHILPSHGCPDRIGALSYDRRLLRATEDYIEALLACPSSAELANRSLKAFIAPQLRMGGVSYHAGYEAVHARNVQQVLDTYGFLASPNSQSSAP